MRRNKYLLPKIAVTDIMGDLAFHSLVGLLTKAHPITSHLQNLFLAREACYPARV